MLNYIWAGLIISSLAFALVSDIRDTANDRFRNDDPLSVTLEYPEGYRPEARSVPVRIRIDPERYRSFYGVDETPADGYQGSVIRTQRGTQLRFGTGAPLPDPLSRIRRFSSSADDELQGTLVTETPTPDSSESVAAVQFSPVRFPRLHDITQAAFDFAETAAEIALGLIGVLALFLGLLKIAEAGGLIHQIVRVAEPLIHPFFPEIPKGHPAIGMIVLNLSANVLGLGNAATPLGIKAMEELQELNPSPDTATNSMVMLLAMNTASVQLVPPALLVAVMGLQVNELILPIILVTGSSLIIAVTAAKFLQRLPGYRRSDPLRLAAEEVDDAASSHSTSEDT
ncbi:MAG: nucleoside recognition domain-containing protein [Rhodothermales bacterium]